MPASHFAGKKISVGGWWQAVNHGTPFRGSVTCNRSDGAINIANYFYLSSTNFLGIKNLLEVAKLPQVLLFQNHHPKINKLGKIGMKHNGRQFCFE